MEDLRRSCRPSAARAGVIVAVAANLWLAGGLAYHDDGFARWCRDTADRGARCAASARVPLVTTASWGLRYYVERAGGRVLDSPTETLAGGAVVLVPTLTDRRTLPRPLKRRARVLETVVEPPARRIPLILPVFTLRPAMSVASFYGGYVWFPYAFSRTPGEKVRILLVKPIPRNR